MEDEPVPIKWPESKDTRIIAHQVLVAVAAYEKYGQESLEGWVAYYHDTLEDGLMDMSELLEDLKIESEDYTLFNQPVEEFKKAILAITRNKGEKYFDYIKRCSENPVAARVKVLDLKENRFKRGNCPETLKKRYDKALSMLAELGYN